MADKTLRFNIFARDENTKRTLDGIADAAENAGDEFAEMGRDAKRLDNEVEDLQHQIQRLKLSMVGIDGDQFKDMDRQVRSLEHTLGRKLNVKKAFGDAGDDGGRTFLSRFAGVIGSGASMLGPLKTGLVTAAAAAAPEMAALIGAGVSGGVALGVVGIGAAIAAQDERVQAAGSRLGATLSAGFKADADVMVEPLLRGIDRVGAKFQELRPVFRDMFEVGAGNADVLFAGLIDGSDEVIKDLAEINRNATPVINVLGRDLPEAAAAASGALKQLSSDSEFNAKSLDMMLKSLEATIAGTGFLLKGLDLAAKYSTIGTITDAFGNTKTNAEAAGQAVNGFTGFLGGYTAAASLSAQATKSLDEQMRDLANANSSAFDSETRLEAAVDAATASMKENGKTTNANTEKGRANRDALSALAAQSLATRDAIIAQTHSSAAGEAVMQRGYNAFVKAAHGMGMSKAAADALARSLGLIPPAKNVTITAHTGGATAAVRALQGKIAELQNKHVYITGTVRWVSTGLHVPGGTILARQHGGPVERGKPYIVGEKRAELFVPGQSGRIEPRVPYGGGDVVGALVQALSRVTVVMDGRTAGRMTARTGDVYARGE